MVVPFEATAKQFSLGTEPECMSMLIGLVMKLLSEREIEPSLLNPRLTPKHTMVANAFLYKVKSF